MSPWRRDVTPQIDIAGDTACMRVRDGRRRHLGERASTGGSLARRIGQILPGASAACRPATSTDRTALILFDRFFSRPVVRPLRSVARPGMTAPARVHSRISPQQPMGFFSASANAGGNGASDSRCRTRLRRRLPDARSATIERPPARAIICARAGGRRRAVHDADRSRCGWADRSTETIGSRRRLAVSHVPPTDPFSLSTRRRRLRRRR